MKVIYIASEPRAGSTFLQLLLSTHPAVVGLGEIAQVIKRARFIQEKNAHLPPCSCGAEQNDCPFWAPLLPQLFDGELQSGHHLVLNRFRSEFPDSVLVDSSKNMEALQAFYLSQNDPDIELHVIYLIRDFRGWVPSVHKRRLETANYSAEDVPAYSRSYQAELHRRRRSLKALRYGYVQDCYRWLHRTQTALRFLEERRVPHLVVSYEELVFRLDAQSKRIGDFLGLEFSHDSGNLTSAEAHELYGSDTVRKPQSGSRVFYDHWWLRDPRSAWFAPLIMPVHAFNRRVYQEMATSPARHASRAEQPQEAVR